MRAGVPLALLLCGLGAICSARPLERYRTAHRLGVSLGLGFGSASLAAFHQGVDDARIWIESRGLKLDDTPKSGLQTSAEISLRYYFPYYLLAQVGYGMIYNRASTGADIGPVRGSVGTAQMAMEIPILIGGYYPCLGRIYVFAALGPSPFFHARSSISADPGANSLLELAADAGVGFQALLGAEVLLTRVIGLGLELRYRYLSTGDLHDQRFGLLTSGFLRGDSEARTYNLDFSGIGLMVTFRPFIL